MTLTVRIAACDRRAFIVAITIATVCAVRWALPMRSPLPALAPRPAAEPTGWSAPVVELPAGWFPIESDARESCGYDDHPYVVAIEAGALHISTARHRETDTGPAVPFFSRRHNGQQHALAVEDGYVVGLAAGEWGGSLSWVARTGKRRRRLEPDDWNVAALVRHSPREVLSLEWTARDFTARARWLERVAGKWQTTKTVPLDDRPEAFVTTTDGVYVMTGSSLNIIRPDRTVTIIQPLRANASSMAVDSSGRLWIGSSGAVLRLTAHGKRFDEAWFVEAPSANGCWHPRQTSLDAPTCVGPG